MAVQGAKPNFLKHITLMLRPNTLAWPKDIKEIIKKPHSIRVGIINFIIKAFSKTWLYYLLH
ncbi:MAG: hypothetical protein CMP75_02860 [Flavobacteriales bacterium]|nr:hypothetical protein [Flavobacteriales bacterium]